MFLYSYNLFLYAPKRIFCLVFNKYAASIYRITKRQYNEVTGNTIVKNVVRGIDHLRNPRLNKGLAFTLKERQALGIHGLLAPDFMSQEQQLNICNYSIDRYKNNLNKYLYLIELQDTNEKLFFSLLSGDVEKYLPIVYTPTVGLACQRFGLAYRRPRGLFISINDKGHVLDIVKNWPEHDVRAIVFTDGERILGLGDLGAYGMGIPVGKLALYTALAGIKPHQCLPVTLDCGTDNKRLQEDPLYIGLRRSRIRGQEYDDFIEEFMIACTQRYGPNVLLQFEDFAMENASRLLEKYRDNYCTFNDDIQGTASVAVAGLFASVRITKKKLSDQIFMFLGAGSAATGIANLLVLAAIEEGKTQEEAREKIYMFDINGLLTTSRKDVPKQAIHFCKNMDHEKDFLKAVQSIKPACLIGCSTSGGAFTADILKEMAKNTERPIIFALSNPTAKAECTAQQAYDNTEGRCVFASGSPFPPVKYNEEEYNTGQGNNAYIFPGVALGVIWSRAHFISEDMFLTAARTLANFVSEKDLAQGRIYPPLAEVKNVSLSIAVDVAKLAYSKDIATLYPKPLNFESSIRQELYQLHYQSYLPDFYDYPEAPIVKIKSISEAYKKHIPVLRKPSAK